MLRGPIVFALFVPLSLVVAGCVSSGSGVGAGGEPAASAEACALAYPDGSPIDCATSQAAQASEDGRPAVGSGWNCITRWIDETGGRGLFEVYRHGDGRAGLYWESIPWKTPGHAFVVANVFESLTKGQALVVDWSPKGFAVFPENPPATAEVHLIVRNFFLDTRDENGLWTANADARLAAGRYLGHDWFVWSFEAGGAVRHVDTVEPKTKENSLRQFSPAKRLIEGDGWTAFSSVQSWGNKWTKFSFETTAGMGRCDVTRIAGVPLAG